MMYEKTLLRKKSLLKYSYQNLSVYLLLFLVIVISSIMMPFFWTRSNIMNIIRQNSSILIVACGTQLVLIGGEFDMSTGATTALCGCIAALIMSKTGILPLAILISILIGLIIGYFNGKLATTFGISSLIITIATQLIIHGITMTITNAQPITNIGSLAFFGSGTFAFISMPVLFMLSISLTTWFILNHLRYGRLLYATGSNRNAAKASGVNIYSIITSVFMIQGLFAAVAGIILTARLNSGQPTSAEDYYITAIAATAIGGTSLKGGRGKISGTIGGVFFIGLLTNLLTYLGLNSNIQQIILGILILFAVITDANAGFQNTI